MGFQMKSCGVTCDPLVMNKLSTEEFMYGNVCPIGPGCYRRPLRVKPRSVSPQGGLGKPFSLSGLGLPPLSNSFSSQLGLGLSPQPLMTPPQLFFLHREHIKPRSSQPPTAHHNLPVLCSVSSGSCPLLSNIYP